MAQGKVKWFDNKKGFGFIEQNEGPDIFVHFSELKDEGFKALYEGDIVEYATATGPKGETATEVKVITRSETSSNSNSNSDSSSFRPDRPPRTRPRQGRSEGIFNRSIEEQLKALRKSSKENQQDLANRQKRR